MGTLFGVTGQSTYNLVDTWRMKRELSEPSSQNTSSGFGNLLNSSWSPVKFLSKEDYEKILNEKLLAADAEIAIVEEEIASMKQKLAQRVSKSDGSQKPS